MEFINVEKDNSTLLEMDSTFCKVHQSELTGGQVHAPEPALALLDNFNLVGKKILADKE